MPPPPSRTRDTNLFHLHTVLTGTFSLQVEIFNKDVLKNPKTGQGPEVAGKKTLEAAKAADTYASRVRKVYISATTRTLACPVLTLRMASSGLLLDALSTKVCALCRAKARSD